MSNIWLKHLINENRFVIQAKDQLNKNHWHISILLRRPNACNKATASGITNAYVLSCMASPVAAWASAFRPTVSTAAFRPIEVGSVVNLCAHSQS